MDSAMDRTSYELAEREQNARLHALARTTFAGHRTALDEHLKVATIAINALNAHSQSYSVEPALPLQFSVWLTSVASLNQQHEQRIEDLNRLAIKWFNEAVRVCGESPNVGWRQVFPEDRGTWKPGETDTLTLLDMLFTQYAGVQGERRIFGSRARAMARLFNWYPTSRPHADIKAGTFRFRTKESFERAFRGGPYKQEFTWQRRDEIELGASALVWLARYRGLPALAADADALRSVVVDRRGYVNAGEKLSGANGALELRIGVHQMEFKLSPDVAEALNVFLTEHFFTPAEQVA